MPPNTVQLFDLHRIVIAVWYALLVMYRLFLNHENIENQ